jgi:hypothetical protein
MRDSSRQCSLPRQYVSVVCFGYSAGSVTRNQEQAATYDTRSRDHSKPDRNMNICPGDSALKGAQCNRGPLGTGAGDARVTTQ